MGYCVSLSGYQPKEGYESAWEGSTRSHWIGQRLEIRFWEESQEQLVLFYRDRFDNWHPFTYIYYCVRVASIL